MLYKHKNTIKPIKRKIITIVNDINIVDHHPSMSVVKYRFIVNGVQYCVRMTRPINHPSCQIHVLFTMSSDHSFPWNAGRDVEFTHFFHGICMFSQNFTEFGTGR